MTITRFEDLEVWQDARALCRKVKDITDHPPFCNDFRFRDQIRASSGSVMDNIAEGFERGGNKEFIQFLSIAKGSAAEVRSQLYRAADYNYIHDGQLTEMLNMTEMIRKKIGHFINYLKKSAIKGTKYK